MNKKLSIRGCLMMAVLGWGISIQACPVEYLTIPNEPTAGQEEYHSTSIQLVGTATEKALPMEMKELKPQGKPSGV
ncbi:MAG: hypothetical protein SPE98_07455, partial [Bacteroidaceae bacterium]|nr:hypothetical protein [Bacteroidaceae bacterium]